MAVSIHLMKEAYSLTERLSLEIMYELLKMFATKIPDVGKNEIMATVMNTCLKDQFSEKYRFSIPNVEAKPPAAIPRKMKVTPFCTTIKGTAKTTNTEKAIRIGIFLDLSFWLSLASGRRSAICTNEVIPIAAAPIYSLFNNVSW